MKKTVVTVKQDAEKPLPVEILADSIKAISDGIKKLRAGPLTDKALILLIQHAAPTFGKYPAKRVGTNEIKAVIAGMESLEYAYLKRKPK